MTVTSGGSSSSSGCGREPVGDDDVGRRQRLAPADGDEARVARPAPDEGDAGSHDAVAAVGERAAAQGLDGPVAHPGRAPRVAAAVHGHGDVVVAAHRGRDGGAGVGDVGAHAEHAQQLGLGGDLGVDLRVVGGRDRVPGVGEVAVGVAAGRAR